MMIIIQCYERVIKLVQQPLLRHYNSTPSSLQKPCWLLSYPCIEFYLSAMGFWSCLSPSQNLAWSVKYEYIPFAVIHSNTILRVGSHLWLSCFFINSVSNVSSSSVNNWLAVLQMKVSLRRFWGHALVWWYWPSNYLQLSGKPHMMELNTVKFSIV
jgi:hypothetical protein